MTNLRLRASEELRKLAAAHRAKRAEVKTLNVGSIAKRAIRSVLAAEAVRERAAVKLRLDDERAACKPKNYRDWVTERAARGDSAAISQLRRFLYQDRRLVQDRGLRAGEVSIQGAGAGDWREWRDTPEMTEAQRRHKLLGEIQTIRGKIDQRTGHVSYEIGGRKALLDAGQTIWLLDRREATVLAGLEMAVQKFGPQLEVTGREEQKKQIALVAAKHGLQVEFNDRALQQLYQAVLVGHRRVGLDRGDRERGDFER